ncbi:uncharacterized protein LOC121725734 [Aricia agestis]|uniref:uncharacterized protein LOC121725734 n=1 Tax=Aricia agestis TaxID=91739 RepID=UPI001C203055|nr:uncharacterized protein LOC121725734 [Aricia agestis]
MNVKVTTFTNPFSFFCVSDNNYSVNETYEPAEDAEEARTKGVQKNFMSDVNHGQYVLVMWKNKWSRGIVNMQTQFLIWLVDFGIFVRPNDKTVLIDLPSEYKKYPSKVFEASVHGVVPMDKILCVEDCNVTSKRRTHWTQGSVERAQSLLNNAIKTVFHPIAILTTKHNEIVLGDLIIYHAKGKINLIEELDQWPGFLDQDSEAYITGLSSFYTSRRHHRACLLKPSFPDLDIPYITLETASIEYFTIIKALKSKLQETRRSDTSEETDISISTAMCDDVYALCITPGDIEKYSKRYILINDRNYNVLHILKNKARDLRMCEQYKDHDRKSIGRACFYNKKLNF